MYENVKYKHTYFYILYKIAILQNMFTTKSSIKSKPIIWTSFVPNFRLISQTIIF